MRRSCQIWAENVSWWIRNSFLGYSNNTWKIFGNFLTFVYRHTWCQFHQRSTYRFYACRSQKRQMTLLTSLSFFAHSGSTCLKAVRRTLMKLTAGLKKVFCNKSCEPKFRDPLNRSILRTRSKESFYGIDFFYSVQKIWQFKYFEFNFKYSSFLDYLRWRYPNLSSGLTNYWPSCFKYNCSGINPIKETLNQRLLN